MCGVGSLVYDSGHRVEIKASGCKRWSCPTCAPNRKANLEIRLKSGNPTRFLTLTVNPNRHGSPIKRRKKMGEAFPILMRMIERKTGVKPEYAVVVEDTIKGEPHLHVMLECPFISKKLLKGWWYKLTGAYIIKINLIRKVRDVARYMTKYMSKDPVKFGNCKRYWFSKGYRKPAEVVEDDERFQKGKCQWNKSYPEEVAWSYQQRAYYLLPSKDDAGWRTLLHPEVYKTHHEACARAFSG